MKRFRVYDQYKGSLRKVKGIHIMWPKHMSAPTGRIDVPTSGFDDIKNAEQVIKELSRAYPDTQYCIIDYKTGKIVRLYE
jgi:hypothetical protein